MSALKALHAPTTVDEAVRLLSRGEARCLAGGATLVAMMNAGIAEPEELVNLAGIEELAGIRALPDESLRIGAMARHRETASDARLGGQLSVVREAAASIANVPVRNMGTMGGSISHFDPAADYPPALVAAGARIEIAGAAGRRTLPAHEFFVDWYTTALAAGELVTAVLLPAAAPGLGRYDKLARVSGDFATVSVALSIQWRAGACERVGLAVGGCGPRPLCLDEANEALVAGRLGERAAEKAGALLVRAADPIDDVRGSAEYRRLVIPRMVGRAVSEARASLMERA
jgi:carbon-monoxide dehydrogenase medium subunit